MHGNLPTARTGATATGLVSIKAWLQARARRGLDILLPPRCLACPTPVASPGHLCAGCWAEMDFVEAPICHCCGWPFDYDQGAAALCGACAGRPPAFDAARAVFRYDDASRRLILALKHGDRLEGVPAFARWMVRAGAELLATCDLVVPVPLHRWRLLRRRYNQAALLAQAVAGEIGARYEPRVLVRRRATPSQGGLNRAQRRRNVRGAFACPATRADRLAGKRVALIDDVMTTGATVESCARALKRRGAAEVVVVTLARVAQPASLAV